MSKIAVSIQLVFYIFIIVSKCKDANRYVLILLKCFDRVAKA